MVLWPGTALAAAGPSSNAASLRAGGGSPVEPAGASALGIAGPRVRKELRLRSRKDFQAVLGRGRAWHNELLVLRTLPNTLPHNRYGFVTSGRLGKAVTRNRVRRRLREGVRTLTLQPGWDVVISAKVPAARASFHELNRAAVALLAKAGMLREEAAEGGA